MNALPPTSVALLVFNRPEPTRRVMAAIRAVRPASLFVIGDGPRPLVPEDAERCRVVREITEQVDWDCRVSRRYSDENLGCRDNVVSGLDWVFKQTEEAIILEDDCLPDPSFFRYCTELLDFYRLDERVGAISGDNFQFGWRVTEDSYYFSRFCHIWGWATWRRAWQAFDPQMQDWPERRSANWLAEVTGSGAEAHYWKLMFDDSWRRPRGGMETWDIPWQYHCWRSGMLTATPGVNLVRNVGFGADSTHTSAASPLAGLPAHELEFPLTHPKTVAASEMADRRIDRTCFSGAGPMAWVCRARLPVPIYVLRRISRMRQK